MAKDAGKTDRVGTGMSGEQASLGAPESGGFVSLGLSSLFLAALAGKGVTAPTEIQKKVIPRLLGGESLIFRSATGTGKTFAYLLPLLERFAFPAGGAGPGDAASGGVRRGFPLLLIAAPTIELCAQIKNEADFLLKTAGLPFRAALLAGSAAPGRQIELLKKERPEVIVGNPGRIVSLARTGKLRLRQVRFLVLDEGDRLTGDDLAGETGEMVSLLEPGFQGIACSATVPEKSLERLFPLLGIPPENRASAVVDDTGEDILRNNVEHWAFFSPLREKFALLRSLAAALAGSGAKGGNRSALKVLVFTGRGRQVENIAAGLRRHRYSAAGLSGDMDKVARKRALDNFRSGKIGFLVTSDLAARGLDITGVSHVIALDVSEDRGVYIHRAGRTARAGKDGVMISVGTEGELRRLQGLEKSLGIIVYPKDLYGGRIVAAGGES